jgi:hypothetical protein
VTLTIKVIHIRNYGKILLLLGGRTVQFNAVELIDFILKSWSSGIYLLHHQQHQHHKNHHHFYLIITLITFITILTILLSARHVYEIGILALQVDESIVMKLMMSSKRNAGLYRENRCGSPL